jgi:hypothetical protein
MDRPGPDIGLLEDGENTKRAASRVMIRAMPTLAGVTSCLRGFSSLVDEGSWMYGAGIPTYSGGAVSLRAGDEGLNIQTEPLLAEVPRSRDTCGAKRSTQKNRS